MRSHTPTPRKHQGSAAFAGASKGAARRSSTPSTPRLLRHGVVEEGHAATTPHEAPEGEADTPSKGIPPRRSTQDAMKKVLREAEMKRKLSEKKHAQVRAMRTNEGRQMREQMGEVRRKDEAERQHAEQLAISKRKETDRRLLQQEEAAWHHLEGLQPPAVLTLEDLRKCCPSAAAMRCRLEEGDVPKNVFNELYRRWHPDKFMPKFSKLIPEDERPVIHDTVTKTWRILRRYADKLEEN